MAPGSTQDLAFELTMYAFVHAGKPDQALDAALRTTNLETKKRILITMAGMLIGKHSLNEAETVVEVLSGIPKSVKEVKELSTQIKRLRGSDIKKAT